MANPHLDGEQLDQAKAWWRRNGTAVVWGVVLGLGAVIGINGWQTWKARQAEAASLLLSQTQQAWRGGDADGARQLGARVLDDYGSTAYADPAALFLARVEVESGDIEAAKSHLERVIHHSADVALVHTARLRLARLYLAEGEADSVLELLSGIESGAFASQYHELRGDALRALRDLPAAHAAYREAMAQLLPGESYREILQRKLDATTPSTESGG